MSQSVSLGRYSFNLGTPLADLSLPYASAYATADDPDYPNGLYALVLNNKTPIRLDVLQIIEGAKLGALQIVIAHGVIVANGMERLALILTKPLGVPLAPKPGQPWPHFKDEELRQHIVKPVFQAMLALRERGLAHGNINPTTIFYTPGRTANVMLSECVSSVPGLLQPALFEPLERAMTMPQGKSNPTFDDDLFALGVTIFLLAIGGNPFANLTLEQIVAARIEVGSSTWLLTTAKPPAFIIEVVRGLCADDARQRWTPSDLEAWLMGHRISPKPAGTGGRAARAITVGGQDYTRPQALALALAANPAATRAVTESRELPRWLQRNFGDGKASERIEALLAKNSGNSDELLAAQISMIVDPAAPIRYKKLRVMPGGLSSILSNAILEKKTDVQQAVGEIIQHNLPGLWVSLLGNSTPANLATAKAIDTVRHFMTSTSFGGGVERLVYELNKGTPCLSDHFTRRYVLHTKQFLTAMEDVASGAHPSEIMDRHAAAWLAAHQPASDEFIFKSIGAKRDSTDRHLEILSLLANLQLRNAVGPLPKLAGWLAELVKPAIEQFHNRALREKIQKNIGKLIATGDLRQLLRAVDSPQTIESDFQAFRDAAQHFKYLDAQIAETQVLIDNKLTVGIMVGRRIAVIVAVTIAGLAICASLANIL